MAVIARVDPHCIRDDAAKAHPEWVAVDANGQKARHMVMRDRWLSCALGPCNFEFMPQVLREIAGATMSTPSLPTAGRATSLVIATRAPRSSRKLRDTMHREIRSERGWAEFQRWRSRRLLDVWDAWDAAVRKVKPHVCCLLNMGGVHRAEMTQVGQRAEMVAADRQGRNAAAMPPWAAGFNAKVYRSVMGDKPVAGICSVGNDDAHRWKDSVQSAAELRLWILECIAQGMHPWVVKFCGTLYDRRWMPWSKTSTTGTAENEQFLHSARNFARVGVVWSPQTSAAIGNAKTEASQLGIYQCARRSSHSVRNGLRATARCRSHQAIQAADPAEYGRLSDAQCGKSRQFVDRGGSIVATFETSLYDESGRKRKDFGLADLFGVRYGGKTESFVKNSYINIEHDTNTRFCTASTMPAARSTRSATST